MKIIFKINTQILGIGYLGGIRYLTLLFLLLATVFSTNSCQQISDQKVAYLAHTLPITHPVHQGMEVFAEQVVKLSNGQLKVKIFPDGQLGTEREVLELLQIGSIAMTKVSAAAMANFAPEYKVMGVPYLFRDKGHLFNVLEGEIGESILEAGSEYLLRGLCFYDAGSRSFYTKNQPIRTPQDLDGLKIRVMNHQMSVDMVNQMGGSATPMAYGELYTALQQGVVDGAENNPPSFITSGHYEVCKYYTLDEHSSIPDVLVIGTKYWQTLSEEEQQWMKDAAKISVTAQKKFWSDNVAECMQQLAAANVEIIRPDKSLFAEKTQAVLQEFATDPKMKTLVEQIKATN
ncbi:MAG: TRAP transporter substrate-binding protein [Saprospiraceae bacterium]